MKRVEISAEVWDEIAKRGKFGETVDDVLRRVFGLSSATSGALGPGRSQAGQLGPRPKRGTHATVRMSAYVRADNLTVEFWGGAQREFPLPSRQDKSGIRRVRDAAVIFARENGASYGQEMAVKKALTEAGYHLTK